MSEDALYRALVRRPHADVWPRAVRFMITEAFIVDGAPAMDEFLERYGWTWDELLKARGGLIE